MARNNRNPHSKKRTRNPEQKPKAQTKPTEITTLEPQTVVCPKCGAKLDLAKNTILTKGGIVCPECGQWILVRLHPDLSRYVRGLGVTSSGADTLDVADQTADLLRGLGLDDLYAVVADHLEKCGFEAASKSFLKEFGKDTPWEAENLHAFLRDRYADRNPGMQRMNLGNVLRAAMNRRSILNMVEK